MRRFLWLPLFLILSLMVVIVAAQEDPQTDKSTPVPVSTVEPTVFEKTDNLTGNGPLIINAGEGSDTCESATPIDDGQGGIQFDVAAMTQSPDDPTLDCMWGNPSSLQGYRTVWYRFTPTKNAIMTLSTLPAFSGATNAYDTVLAVHTGSCGTLQTLACNDDNIGFSSTLTMNVKRNVTYYIEVADWQAGGNAVKLLDLSLQIDPFDSFWQTQSNQPPTLTARQASVVIGSNIYLIGGRGSGGSLLNNFQKLDTVTGTWEQLSPIPANLQGNGLLNTTAVYLPGGNGLNPRIYVPGGSASSSDAAYSREHQYYEFRANGLSTWNTAPTLVGGSAITETFAYAAAAPNNARDEYFLTGGIVGQGYPLTTTSTVTNRVLLYDPSSDNWYTRAPMLSPRYGHVAANVGGRLCVAGGLNIGNGATVLIPYGECASGTSPTSWFATLNMQIPRYFAHSSVGPDGKWYVYGGIDAKGKVVPEVEVYDPNTNRWSLLNLRYDLLIDNDKPLVWPGGGFVGNYLWMAGGSYDPTGLQLNPIVAKAQILPQNTYLPVVMNGGSAANHSFADAFNIPFNTTISQNFSSVRELVNVYTFDVNLLRPIQVALTDIASQAHLNVYLYGENKNLIASNELPFVGIDKTITMPLNPGRYYVVVRFIYSANPDDYSDTYHLRING